jgi:quercetin dioxygenase-like cupin family protein
MKYKDILEMAKNHLNFTLTNLIQQHASTGKLYLEFLREPSMSMGLYKLSVGATDPQQPHSEDEVYYVVSGKGAITVGADHYPVETGSIVFVPAHEEHRFVDVEEELTILVFFAPAEYTNQ